MKKKFEEEIKKEANLKLSTKYDSSRGAVVSVSVCPVVVPICREDYETLQKITDGKCFGKLAMRGEIEIVDAKGDCYGSIGYNNKGRIVKIDSEDFGCFINRGVLDSILGDLGALERLSLKGCNLERVPSSIIKLKSLKYFNLDDNSLTGLLPNNICNLRSLECLSLEGNYITVLPKNIGNLKSLKSLCLSRNCLKHLPLSISDLKSLKRLDIAGNDLVDLPEQLANLPYLSEGKNIYFALLFRQNGNPPEAKIYQGRKIYGKNPIRYIPLSLLRNMSEYYLRDCLEEFKKTLSEETKRAINLLIEQEKLRLQRSAINREIKKIEQSYTILLRQTNAFYKRAHQDTSKGGSE